MIGKVVSIGRGLILLWLLLLFSAPAWAADQVCPRACPDVESRDKAGLFPDNPALAGRGCCSHHKGVCGCRNGRVQCCDGTQSPTCTCWGDDFEAAAL